MAWNQKSTSQSVTVDADVDIGEFTEEQMLQGLIDSKWLSKEEAEAIKKRAATKQQASVVGAGIDAEELAEARFWMLRGQKYEALLHIERFLGREWQGRLS